jgi:hypothetical protein
LGSPEFFWFTGFFFSLVGSPERPLRVAGSLPLAVAVDRGHPQWPDLFFFWVRRKSRRRWAANGGGWQRLSPEVGGGFFIWWLDLLIWCIDFIFSLCIFLKLLKCQLMNGGQKSPPFCHDRMAAALC